MASADPLCEDSAAGGKPCRGCRRCSAGGSALERCVFCHAADGAQYVPAHFALPGDEASLVPFSAALESHCACPGCWAAWERHRSGRGGAASCPVCQQHVDAGRGYPGEGLCRPCLELLLLRRPRASRASCCSCCSCRSGRGCCCSPPVLVLLLLLAFGPLGLALESVLRVLLAHSLDEFERASGGELARALPPGLQEVLCPAVELLGALPGGPAARAVLEAGARLCGPRSKDRPRGRTRRARGSRPRARDGDATSPKQEL